jgi:transcription antitermination protein NusB
VPNNKNDNKSNDRSMAREFAFQFLFHLQLPIFDSVKKELLSQEDDQLLEKTYEELQMAIPCRPEGEPRNFAITLLKGVLENYYSLNSLIEDNLEHWKIERLSKVDLTILLLSIYELTIFKETPHKVVMNEAIELGKKFSTVDSNSFINGVLDKIHQNAQ